MKYRKITAVILAVATAICAAGCNGNDNSGTSSSGDVTSSGSGDSSMTSDNTTSGGNSATAQTQFTFSQVAMGGGGFVSGVFATSEQGLYYARTDVGGAYRYNKDTQKWESMSYDISEEDRGLLGIDGLAFGEKDPNKVYMLAGTEYFSNGKTCLLYSDDYGKTMPQMYILQREPHISATQRPVSSFPTITAHISSRWRSPILSRSTETVWAEETASVLRLTPRTAI